MTLHNISAIQYNYSDSDSDTQTSRVRRPLAITRPPILPSVK